MINKLSTIISVLFLSTFAFGGWSQWKPIPQGIAVGEPSIVVTKEGTIHVMARGTDDALWWTRSPNGGKNWYGNKPSEKWTKVGGILTSSPSCMEPMANVVECYVRNAENGVSQINRINNAWGAWYGVGGVLLSNVSAFSPDESARVIFGVNTNGDVAMRSWQQRAGWLLWRNESLSLGKNAQIGGCGSISGNSYDNGSGAYTHFQYACVARKPNGELIMFNSKDCAPPAAQKISAAEGSPYAPQIRLRDSKNGPVADVYFIGNDKQMKWGVYLVGSGWTKSPENIANGVFTAPPSCDGGPAKFKYTHTCMGRGTDGAIWYSFRTKDQ